MTLRIFHPTLGLTDGSTTPFEFTAVSPESACRGAVANFHRRNPTKRVEYADIVVGDRTQRWLPHLEGWQHEQPAFVNAHVKAGTEL